MLSLRSRLLAATMVLAVGCSENNGNVPDKASVAGGEAISCALGGAAEFKPACAVERDRQGDTLFLVVHHPNGGFRRFEVLKDGRGLAVADGADEGEMQVASGTLAVAVAGDRYRFPATIKDTEENRGNAEGK